MPGRQRPALSFAARVPPGPHETHRRRDLNAFGLPDDVPRIVRIGRMASAGSWFPWGNRLHRCGTA